CLMDIFGHPFGVAANIKVCSRLQPLPKLGSVFFHPMLHVNLVGLIAGEGQIKSVQFTGSLILKKFVAIEKIAGPMLLAEDEPVLSRRAFEDALLEKGAERGNASARPAHNDV